MRLRTTGERPHERSRLGRGTRTVVGRFLLLAGGLGLVAPTGLADAQTKPTPDRIAPLLRTLVRVEAQGGFTPGPDLRLGRPAPRPARLVTIRFTRPLTGAEEKRLEGRGVVLRRPEGATRFRDSPIQVAAVTPAGLAHLGTHPLVARVEARPFAGPRPYLTHNLEEAQALPLWSRRDPQGQPLTGQGVVIGDLDASLDVFHPAFFRADGALHTWHDGDGNGRFDPGVDWVDLDEDGRQGRGETLRLLEGTIHYRNSQTDPWQDNDDRRFQPSLDHLYADLDEDRERDFGPESGFGEQDPTFGEPLFVADDVDGNDRLDPGERLRALRTSKIKAYRSLHTRRTFRRGIDLIQTPRPGGPSHGTGVAGILIGNHPSFHAFSGIAPDAELLFADQDFGAGDDTDALLLSGLRWLVDQGAQLVLHEFGTPLFQFGDGAGVFEQTLDEMTALGVVQCAAAHNYADSPMHAATEAAAGQSRDLGFAIHRIPGYPTSTVYGTLRWREPGTSLRLGLILPDGRVVELPENDLLELGDGVVVVGIATDLSERGTRMSGFYLYRTDSTGQELRTLSPGTYGVRVSNPGDQAQPFHFHLADDTGYATTIGLTDPAVTAAGTLAWPGTADTAFTVGAYRGNFELYEDRVEEGDLRRYSGRDPRIDGARALDLVAPDDTVTALFDPAEPYAHYELFSGTSGSLPVVAGVVALARQARPELDPLALTDLLRQGATADRFTRVLPNFDWGFGKVAAYRALVGREPPANRPPVARVQVAGEVFAGRPVLLDARGSTDPEGGTLQAAWDVGYDGELDGAPEADLTREAVFPEPGEVPVVLQVFDPEGRTARSLLVLTVQPPQAEEDLGVPDGGAEGEGEGEGSGEGEGEGEGGGEGEGEGEGDGEGEGGGEGDGEGEGGEGESEGGGSSRRDQGCDCATAGGGARLPGMLATLLLLGVWRWRTRTGRGRCTPGKGTDRATRSR
ncbi:MAG: S8 family serine peptidase [Myxococcota bacterium]|jgi:subtilisin family serine protease|nr:S8 family serine peptidase [Myxococcota bacterium]